jgi:HEPN domain-containing protein
MENKRVDKELAKEFFLTALNDLKSAKLELEGKIFNNSVYHSQQAIEKAIKALLILHNQFVETHFVADRIKGLVDNKVVEHAKSLEKNWILTRYPFRRKTEIWSPRKAFTEVDAIEALEKAKFVVNEIEKILKEKYGLSFGEEK